MTKKQQNPRIAAILAGEHPKYITEAMKAATSAVRLARGAVERRDWTKYKVYAGRAAELCYWIRARSHASSILDRIDGFRVRLEKYDALFVSADYKPTQDRRGRSDLSTARQRSRYRLMQEAFVHWQVLISKPLRE